MKPVFFSSTSAFRKWLEKYHNKKTELFVGYYKVGTGKPSMTWSESVDEALCFGWIDGIRKSIDAERYMIRFTPRKTTSIWSKVNILKVKKLIKLGRMQTPGIESYKKRAAKKSGIYTYENESSGMHDYFEKKLKANKKAWTFYKSQAPSYQKTVLHRIVIAKQEATRQKRLHELIADCEAGKKIKALSYR